MLYVQFYSCLNVLLIQHTKHIKISFWKSNLVMPPYPLCLDFLSEKLSEGEGSRLPAADPL